MDIPPSSPLARGLRPLGRSEQPSATRPLLRGRLMAAFPFATAERFTSLMDNPEMARLWLSGLGVRDWERALRDFRDLAGRGLPLRSVARLAGQLDAILPRCPDPGMALTNLER